MKIAIVGHSGSGKSTLARNLSKRFNNPVLHLDTVQFKENWVERDLEESLTIVRKFMENDSWIIDGSYTKFLQEERLKVADIIIYLNLNRFSCFWRAFKRYIKNRGRTREDMADGCAEKFDLEFALWILKDGRIKKRINTLETSINQYPNKLITLKSQKQINKFLQEINVKKSPMPHQ